MASYVSLRDIRTSPKSNKVETYHAVGDGDILDEIEYCLGLERGDIKHYNDEDLLRAELHSDMAKLSKDAQWALVPSGDALQSMIELFEGNHAKNPSNRTLFKDIIPPQTPFEYKFMGLKQRKGKFFYANGKKYEFPFDDFPIIRSNLHPCFLLPSLVRCMNKGLITGRKHLTPLGTNRGLASSAFLILNRFFPVSFLGNTVAADFPNRRIPTVRRNPITAPVPTPNEEDAARRIEATPPPDSIPETTGNVNVGHSSPPPEPSERTHSSSEKRVLEKASTPGPAVAGPSRKKRKIRETYPDDSNAQPAKRRSPRFTSS